MTASQGGTGHYPANNSTGTSARDVYGGALSPLSDNRSQKLKVKGPTSKSRIGQIENKFAKAKTPAT